MTQTSSADETIAASNDDIRVEIEETGAVQRSVRVTVANERVRKAFDRTYKELAKSANIRGFRRGKVPRSVLEKYYGASIPEEIERVLIHETLQDALEIAKVLPVVEPEVEAGSPRADEDFEYVLEVEIKPEIALPDLEGLPARRPKVEVSDEEVDERLETMREQNAPFVEEDEDVVVAEGHTVNFDYEGRVDGELFEGGAAEGVDLEIGAGRMIPGFEEGLLDAKAGDEVTLEVTFPEEYGVEHLNGKAAEFACKIHSLKRKQVPELDDEFAKDVGDYETLEELRMKIRSDIRQGRQSEADSELRKSLMEALVERTDFEVPPGLVEKQLQSQLDNLRRQFEGRIPEELIQQQLTRMYEDGRPAAERRVREAYLLDAVARDQGFGIEPDEVDARLSEMAAAQGMDPHQLKHMAQHHGWGDAIEAEMLEKKALDYLISKAEIEEVETPDPDAES